MHILLTVEIGNSVIETGIMKGDELLGTFRLSAAACHTADELRFFLRGFLSENDLVPMDVDDVIIASVAPEKNRSVIDAVKKMFHQDPLLIGPGVKTGIQLRFENPREIGSDRIANAAAAHYLYHRSCIVVNFATAATFDYVSEDGIFEYTIIMPGLEISADALKHSTAKLPGIEIVRPQRILARNTVAGMQAGIVYGFTGSVDAILKEMKKELKDDCYVIASGDHAEMIAFCCGEIDICDPKISHRGLRVIYDLNQKDKTRQKF